MRTVITHADVRGQLCDVVLNDGHIVAVVGPGAADTAGADVMEADGGALLPGLTDHHLHLFSMAAAAESVPLHRAHAPDAATVAEALRHAPIDVTGWVRGIGYDAATRGALTAQALDRIRPDVPMRIQDRSGALWMLNTRALGLLETMSHPGIERDAAGMPTGLLWRADDLLHGVSRGSAFPSLAGVVDSLLCAGITAVTDATPDLTADAARALVAGSAPLRVNLLGAATGTELGSDRARVGARKIVLADSDLMPFADLCATIADTHRAGRGVAVHAVSLDALYLVIAALDEVGVHADDRIEHATLVPDDALGHLAALSVPVVLQPGFLGDRGDLFTASSPTAEHPWLYRGHSFASTGVRFALSSDAPYGPADPWRIMQNAVDRSTPNGALNSYEALTPEECLDTYLQSADAPGHAPRSVRVGAVADLILLPTTYAATLQNLGSARPHTVWVDGAVEVRGGRRT